MAGYTSHAQYYNEQQIYDLVNKYKQQDHKFFNPINNICYPTRYRWEWHIGNLMLPECANKFMFLMDSPKFSSFSGKQLTEAEYSYKCSYKGWKGFRSKLLEEYKPGLATKGRKRSKEVIEKCAQRLREFYATEKGKEVRRKQNEKAKISLKKFYATEEGKALKLRSNKKMSQTIKQKILNGEFTPKPTNTWTHWNAQINIGDKILKFRSSWEACFYVSNQQLKFETIRTEYIDDGGDTKIAICDFVDEDKKIMYELKPTCYFNKQQTKINALIQYCKVNNLKFIWINENNIMKYIDKEKCKQICNEQFEKMIKYVKN